jgi:hypothetical protein
MQLPAPKARVDTVSALDTSWEASPEWSSLKPSTKREWTRHRKRIVAAWGDLEVKGIEPRHVLTLRDQFSATPATANNLLRCLGSMLGWSVPRGYRLDNPCREVKQLPAGEGYAPWPWEVIETAENTLRPDLWRTVALALYTGQRLSDVLAMRWSAINAGAPCREAGQNRQRANDTTASRSESNFGNRTENGGYDRSDG